MVTWGHEKLVDVVTQARKLASSESRRSVWDYLNHVVIDSVVEDCPQPRLFREVAESWQLSMASRIIPAIHGITGADPAKYKGPRSFWFTMPRGHDKTSSIGRILNWVLAYSRKPLRAVCGAADREQAGFITEFMQTEAKLNPWLEQRLDFKNWRVEGRSGTRLRIVSADAFSSYGLKEDLMIFDELTHWPTRGLFDAIVSGREKRPNAVVIIITNAGVLKSWQHEVFLEAQKSPDWYVYHAPHHLASWMTRERIDRLRKMLPPSLARRLYDNVWVDDKEDVGFVTRAEAQCCEDPSLRRQITGTAGFPYVAVIDYGPVRDRTAMGVGHEDDGEVKIDRLDVIQGSKDHRVPIELVEKWIDEVRLGFPGVRFVFDEYNLEGTIQKYQGQIELERFAYRNGKANYEIASNLRSMVVNNRISWYPEAGELLVNGKMQTLVDELAAVCIKPMSYGYRLDNTVPGTHDDRCVVVATIANELMKTARKVPLRLSDKWL